MHIAVVLGTARQPRESLHVAHLITHIINERGVSFDFVDVKDHVLEPYTIPPWAENGTDNLPTKWQEIAVKSDTFIFVLPEYNHSYPGEWKLLMDSLFDEFKGKRAYIAAVSRGAFGGTRVMEHTIPVLNNFSLQTGPERLHITFVEKIFDEDGQLLDGETGERIHRFVDAIVKAA